MYNLGIKIGLVYLENNLAYEIKIVLVIFVYL